MNPAPAFRDKINSGSTPIYEIHQDAGRSPLLHSGSCTPLAYALFCSGGLIRGFDKRKKL